MKVILAGTPKIALETFEKVIENFEVKALITKQDAKQGRGLKLQESPVACLGKKHNILVLKPTKIKDAYKQIKTLNCDLLLTFAYGQFIPQSILDLFPLKPFNIHGSLLPKYRGASPIHYALLNNEKEIGISLIEMVKEMDAGNIYFQAKEKITSETDLKQAFKIISTLAKKNIVSWLKQIQTNKLSPIGQGDNFTLAPKIPKELGFINEKTSCFEALRKVKALS